MDVVRADPPRFPNLSPRALEQAMDGTLGRKHPCWCGSGKRYKHCHFGADQAKVRDRPKMSEILEEMAEPLGLHQCGTREEAEGLILAAAAVWNATRLPDAECNEAAKQVTEMLAGGDTTADFMDAVQVVHRMMDIAYSWPWDKRVVANAAVVADPPRGWRILAASIDER